MVPADYFFWFLGGVIAGIGAGSYRMLPSIVLGGISFFAAAFFTYALLEKKTRTLVTAFFLLGVALGFARLFLSEPPHTPAATRGAFHGVLALRDGFEVALNRSLPEPEASFASGIILGKVRKFPARLEDALRKTSTLHLVAVSGYNITVVASSILGLLLFLTVHRKLAWWLATLGILLFTLFVGAPASAVRAAIMGFLVLLSKRVGRVSDARNALAFAGAAMLLVNPTFLRLDLGFQLSFLATIGILYVSPIISTALFSKRAIGPQKENQLKEIASDSLSAQLMVAPWILYKFGTISLGGIVANILVLPLIPLAMFLSFLTGITGFALPHAGSLVCILTYPVLRYLLGVIGTLSRIPLVSLSPGKPSFLWVLISYAIIAGMFSKLLRRQSHA